MTTPFAITGYEISLFLHITAVMVGFGATFAEAIAAPIATKMDPRHLPYVHRLQIAINSWLATPALVIVLATGIYQAVDGDWEFGDFWISGTFAILIVVGGLLGGYFLPTDRRLEALAAKEVAAAAPGGRITMSDAYQAAARTEGIVGTVVGVLLVVAVFLMVVKPGV